MTKAELIALWADYPDNTVLQVRNWGVGVLDVTDTVADAYYVEGVRIPCLIFLTNPPSEPTGH